MAQRLQSSNLPAPATSLDFLHLTLTPLQVGFFSPSLSAFLCCQRIHHGNLSLGCFFFFTAFWPAHWLFRSFPWWTTFFPSFFLPLLSFPYGGNNCHIPCACSKPILAWLQEQPSQYWLCRDFEFVNPLSPPPLHPWGPLSPEMLIPGHWQCLLTHAMVFLVNLKWAFPHGFNGWYYMGPSSLTNLFLLSSFDSILLFDNCNIWLANSTAVVFLFALPLIPRPCVPFHPFHNRNSKLLLPPFIPPPFPFPLLMTYGRPILPRQTSQVHRFLRRYTHGVPPPTRPTTLPTCLHQMQIASLVEHFCYGV